MIEILTYIESNWVTWMFGIISLILSICYKTLGKRIEEEQQKNDAIAEGMQSLLRDCIVQNYNKYTDRGYCPIYAKESLKRAYHAYHDLGGNDIATELYNKLLKMPEEAAEGEE